MNLDFTKYYVRIYRKAINNESWQTLGPYNKDFAIQLMYNYLKKGICCWIEDVKISE
jgi:hypothetical protein